MNQRLLSLPDEYFSRIETALSRIGYSLTDSRRLARAVLQLSDYYTQGDNRSTPWHEAWAQAASIAYYFPLNYARNFSVAREAARLGFLSGFDNVVDFGSGTGSALFAFFDQGLGGSPALHALDVSGDALEIGAGLSSERSRMGSYGRETLGSGKAGAPPTRRSLLLASYVLTELPRVPDEWLEYEGLVVIEPSTQNAGRRLMRERQALIEAGFRIWAPCTHERPCPLLVHSERDWCHDRIHWNAPRWFTEIESHLPIKNRTLTFSYLLARRSVAPPAGLEGLGRLTGDMLVEKGKTRQSICRGPAREFLAWFPQRLEAGESIELQRGNLVRFNADELEPKSNELRIKRPDSIREIRPEDSIEMKN